MLTVQLISRIAQTCIGRNRIRGFYSGKCYVKKSIGFSDRTIQNYGCPGANDSVELRAFTIRWLHVNEQVELRVFCRTDLIKRQESAYYQKMSCRMASVLLAKCARILCSFRPIQHTPNNMSKHIEKDTAGKQEMYRKWILQWKQCKCSELQDVFQIFLPHTMDDPNTDNGNFYFRLRRYRLKKTIWEKLMSAGTRRIRIHFSVGKYMDQNCVVPLIQASKEEKGRNFGPLYPFDPIMKIPIDIQQGLDKKFIHDGEEIPKALSHQLTNNWYYLHPGFISDQFETFQEEVEPDIQKLPGQKSNRVFPDNRKRVNHYTYDVSNMPDGHDSKLAWVYFHLGVNHHEDRFGYPSFAPVLHFDRTSNHKPVQPNHQLNNGEDLFFEFATPCPHLCDDPPTKIS